MANKSRGRMPASERAKQFLPFAALKGLPEALAVKERITVPKIELSEYMAGELDRKMREIRRGGIVSVVYFHEGEYVRVTGMVARMDETSRILQIVNTKILFDDVLDVETEEKGH